VPSRILVTGASGFVGAALIPRLQRDGHDVRAFGRAAGRVRARVPVVEGDAVTGAGLDAALDGVECAFFLIHSMETAGGPAPPAKRVVGGPMTLTSNFRPETSTV
jgi:uncharacterized protein YbjT (DUF2867 family)